MVTARLSSLSRIARLSLVAHLVLFVALAGTARAQAPVFIEAVELTGIARTRESTLLELLPRPAPAAFTDAEIAEFERRIGNLAIFDQVEVERSGTRLRVRVREKWTLIPAVDLATGKTLADSSAMLGLTEYNILGTGNQLGAAVSREQRGWAVSGQYYEHPYRRRRWSFGVDGSLSNASYRFGDGNGWRSTQGGGWVGMTSPPTLSDYVNFRLGIGYSREVISDVLGDTRPPDGQAIRSMLGVSLDRYHWEDLVPRGVKTSLELASGVLVGPPVAQPRHSAELWAIGALPLSPSTVVMARLSGTVLTRGSANFSALLGSIEGVRGLEDSLYRNWLQAYANVELRQSIRVARRWALQGVLFCDGALFERMTAAGGRGEATSALGAGAGARLVPTWLAGLVLRVDVSRLFVPEQRWFHQLALSQYF